MKLLPKLGKQIAFLRMDVLVPVEKSFFVFAKSRQVSISE
jgi:hypothetical protein